MPGSFFAGVSRRRDSESLGGGEKYRMNHLSVCWLRLRPFTCVRVRPSCEPRRRRCSAKRETHIVASSSSQLTRVSYEQTSARNCFFYSTITVRPAFLLHRSGGIAREIRISRTLPPFGAIDSSINRNCRK